MFFKKEALILLFVLFITTTFIYSQSVEYKLGVVESKKGVVNIDYIKNSAGKEDYIRLALLEAKIYANIYIAQDLTEIRRLIDKFVEWHKIAIDNKWELNKTIGSIKEIRVEFQTRNNQYEIVFVNNKSGSIITSFDLAQIKKFKETITDEKIDLAINSEKRRKEKEDSLFK